jgi:peptidoglycan/xylan/chitin deacetylase (PgdA/CDA1 family)
MPLSPWRGRLPRGARVVPLQGFPGGTRRGTYCGSPSGGTVRERALRGEELKKNIHNPRFLGHYTAFLCVLFSCIPIALPPRTISRPIVVITFDDADTTVYSIAFPAMRSLDTTWAATHFFPVTHLGSPGGITIEQAQEMERAGWESGGHGFTHENLSSVPLDSIESQVKKSRDFLVENKLSHSSFAYAFGNYNETVKGIVAKYFDIIRTAHDYEYGDMIDRKELGYYAVKAGCTANDVIGRVEKAISLGSPLVVIGFHVILPDTAAPVPVYWCKESVFMEFLRFLKKEELPLLTLQKAVHVLCK